MSNDQSLEWEIALEEFDFEKFIHEILEFYRRELDGPQSFEHPLALLGVYDEAADEPAVLESDPMAAVFLRSWFLKGHLVFAPLTAYLLGCAAGDLVPFVDGSAYPADPGEAGTESEYGLVIGIEGEHIVLCWQGRDALNAWLDIMEPTSFDVPLQAWLERFSRR